MKTLLRLSVVLLFAPLSLVRGAERAAEILAAAGVKGGLIVHVGCGDGRLTAALRANDNLIVHGLDTDLASVTAARKHIESLGRYGPVSVDWWKGGALPYVDNSVNLLIADADGRVEMAEAMRVLAPGGVALVAGKRFVKPRPKEMDEWTHFLHGADNNAVARDTMLGPPYHIQWVGDPPHSRSHQFLTSISTMVSAGGRLFAIVDEGPQWLHEFLPAKWSLVARDAFNGATLWKRPLATWQPASQSGRIPFPPDLFRRLVAVGDRVYVTRSLFGPVEALDAATGETVRVYEGTEKTEEIICEGGVLFCVLTTEDPAKVDRRAAAMQRAQPVQKRLVAVRAETGQMLWSKQDDNTFAYQPLTLAAQGRRVVFQNPAAIYCLDAATGKTLWRHERVSPYPRAAYFTPTLLMAGDVVLCADRKPGLRTGRTAAQTELIALDLATGKMLWRCDCAEGHTSSPEVFVIGSEVWFGENPAHKQADFRTVRDLRTGEVRRRFETVEGWATWHHHRCYREKATTQFLLTSRTGVEFIDVATGRIIPHHWIRGVCRYGVLPCNGLLYLPPDQCACYIQSKLHGFHALAPARKPTADSKTLKDEPLERGPAFGESRKQKAESRNEDWPTYRHDAARSGCASTTVPVNLAVGWTAELGGKLTSPVCAEGKLLVALPESHVVLCLDADNGKRLWSFTAGGRVDSPPTLAQGLAVFGARDGWVYALRASDGALAWRFRAAPEDRRLVAHDQLESVWPVHGSTLVEGDAVYVAAGRNSYFDGGVWLHKLDLRTGKPLLTKRYYSRDPKTGERVDLFPPFQGKVLPDREMPGLLPDVFSADRNALYLRSVAITRELELVGTGKAHLFCSMGFVDDYSWERTYWLYGTHMYSGARGWGVARLAEPGGRILVFDETRVFGFDDATSRLGAGLFAAPKNPSQQQATREMTVEAKRAARAAKKKSPPAAKDEDDDTEPGRWTTSFSFDWRKNVPLNVRAMLLSGEVLLVGGPERFDEEAALAELRVRPVDDGKLSPLLAEAMASIEGRRGARLWAVNKADGKRLSEMKLDCAPVFDGMIAAHGKLYISTVDGKVLCLVERK